MSNIPFFGTTGLPGIAQGAANTAAPQGLMDFLGLLLGTVQGEAGTPDLQAKLAALLQNPPAGKEAEAAALLKLLQPANAEARPAQDIVKKLAEMLKVQAQAPASTIRPALTSDLTAASAPVIQDAPAPAPALPLPLPLPLQTDIKTGIEMPSDEKLAALLNEIEPEAGEKPALDRTILHHLLKAAVTEGRDGKDFDHDRIVEFLKKQGVEAEALDKYIVVIEKAVAAAQSIAPAARTAGTPDVEILRAVQAEIAKAQQPEKPAETKYTAPAPKAEDGEKATAAEAKVPAPEAKAEARAEAPPRKPAPAQHKMTEAPAHPSLINSMVSAEGAAEQVYGQDAVAIGVKPAGAQTALNHMTAMRMAEAPMTQMVTVQLQANAANRIDAMTLQLEPANLGRLDIKLKFGKDGGIKAHLSVDKPETLAMLQRDSAQLQRALAQAGFDTDDASLSFDLRQQGQQHSDAGNAQDQGQRGGHNNYMNGEKHNDAALMAQIAVQAQGWITQGGVNIMV